MQTNKTNINNIIKKKKSQHITEKFKRKATQVPQETSSEQSLMKIKQFSCFFRDICVLQLETNTCIILVLAKLYLTLKFTERVCHIDEWFGTPSLLHLLIKQQHICLFHVFWLLLYRIAELNSSLIGVIIQVSQAKVTVYDIFVI